MDGGAAGHNPSVLLDRLINRMTDAELAEAIKTLQSMIDLAAAHTEARSELGGQV